jgi:indolepyruvate decarboxylase
MTPGSGSGSCKCYDTKPVVFVLNNAGYLIERLLCKEPVIEYDVPNWHYSELPKALGCDGWYTAKVTTCSELDYALAVVSLANNGAYIEVSKLSLTPTPPARLPSNSMTACARSTKTLSSSRKLKDSLPVIEVPSLDP